MREGVVEALAAGDRVAWPLVGALWFLLAVLALFHGERATLVRSFALLALAAAASVVAMPLVSALAIPRIVWKADSAADLALPRGESWRRVRGPAVHIEVGGVPDVALPTLDTSGECVLIGILSGQPIPGLSPAPVAAPEVGGARLCSTANDRCRAWPATWPDPSRSPVFAELVWQKDASSALAYDVESGLFLRAPPDLSESAHALELVGKVTNDAPRSSAGGRSTPDPAAPRAHGELRDGTTSLFVLRRIHAGKLDAVRLVVQPGATPPEQTYAVQRASASLVAARVAATWVARPLLAWALASLAVGIAFLLAAPFFFRAQLRRRGALRHEADAELSLAPVTAARGVAGPTTVLSGGVLAGVDMVRGTVVRAQLGADDGSPVRSRAWHVIAVAGQPDASVYVPADPAPFGRAARAWMARRIAVLALGAAVAASLAPAIVAIASIISTR